MTPPPCPPQKKSDNDLNNLCLCWAPLTAALVWHADTVSNSVAFLFYILGPGQIRQSRGRPSRLSACMTMGESLSVRGLAGLGSPSKDPL